jgi:cob(I)alamin adenosyltransferase
MTRGSAHGGDRGETGLPGGARVSKTDGRVVALGEVDELCALLGAAATELRLAGDRAAASVLAAIQRDLFVLGGRLAATRPPSGRAEAKLAWGPERLQALETAIEEREARLTPLRTFILPGGTRAGAWLHVARSVCRRAERAVVGLARGETVDEALVAYLNRLSNLLFVMAREANARAGASEEPW